MNILGIIQIADWFLVVIVLGTAFYFWSTKNFNRFKEHGIPGPKPYPLVGTSLAIFTEGIIAVQRKRLKQYGGLYGGFMGTQPMFFVAKDELLSEILVKQFSCFTNRRAFSDTTDIADNFLTVLKDDDWKRVRNLLTPSFSSGNLKMMIQQMNKCGLQLAENIAQKTSESDAAFETKEISGCYTLDVIGATTYGIDVNSLKDPDNVFVKMAKKIFDMSLVRPIFIIVLFFPWMLKYLKRMGYQVFAKDAMDFFQKVTEEVIAQKKAAPSGQTDLLQLMVNAHNMDIDADQKAEAKELGVSYETDGKEKGLKNVEIIANGILVFLAGYDTTATAMSLLLYQLAIDQDVQEKLYNEIQEVIGDKETVAYNDISLLPYLDMCISESLRMYPPAPIFDRICNCDVTINGIEFKKGEVVMVSTVAIHYDEKRWPNPDVFDPERFTPEMKSKRGPFDWLPFGYGPRNCIGMRLALLEAKIALVQVLKKNRLVPCEKTKVPLKFAKIGFKVKAGIWISAVPRNS